MLSDNVSVATVAVKDMAAAARFYEGILGLTRVHTEGEGAIEYATKGGTLLVYLSQFAGTNRATAVSWNVGDELPRLVQYLKMKGVTFEHYDFPGMTRDGDIHLGGGRKNAWFKDPDGNIHALVA